jgi:hypothetical protein
MKRFYAAFPLVPTNIGLWSSLMRFFEWMPSPVKLGELEIHANRIVIKDRKGVHEFFLDKVENLCLVYDGFDEAKVAPPNSIMALALNKGDKNRITFVFEQKNYSYGFYVADEKGRSGIIHILKYWYDDRIDFKEYFGRVESVYLKSKKD